MLTAGAAACFRPNMQTSDPHSPHSSDAPEARRARILDRLSRQGEVTPADLARDLGVSVQTLRSDLRALEEAGRIRRRHGRATLPPAPDNISYLRRSTLNEGEKARIGARVAALIPDGASLSLGTGTTVEACARALMHHRGLRVFTNSIAVLTALKDAPEVSVMLSGGQVRLRDLDMIGAEACEFFAGLRPDFAISSLGGISADGDLLDFNMDEIRLRRALMQGAAVRILVADSSKFGRSAAHAFGRVSMAHHFVTGGAVPAVVAADCAASGCRLCKVAPEGEGKPL